MSVTLEELKGFIRDRDSDSLEKLAASGGPAGVALKLDSGARTGLRDEQVLVHRAEFGRNSIPPPKPRTYLGFLRDAFRDVTVIVLCCTATLSLILAAAVEKTASAYAEGIAILVAILVVTNVTATNDWRKQRQFMRLNAMVSAINVRVVRNSVSAEVNVDDVVVGDVVLLTVGDILCADGLLLEGSAVKTDESALTGEPKLISKDHDKHPFLLSGTKVMEGEGLFLVVAVGPHSEAGQIRVLVQGGRAAAGDNAGHEEGEGESVLQQKLKRLAVQIGKLGTLAAVLCFVVMVVRFCITKYGTNDADTVCAVVEEATCSSQKVRNIARKSLNQPFFFQCNSLVGQFPCCETTADGAAEIRGSPCPWLSEHLRDFLGFVITAVTVLVVAVPEGLPLAVTLSLAFSVIKMQKDKNLVKHLDACETMGSATTICSDKTGTLTKNRMTVMRVFLPSADIAVFKSEQGQPVGQMVRQVLSAQTAQLIAEGVALNSSGDIVWNEELKMHDQIGNKTDCALLTFAQDLGVSNYVALRHTAKSQGRILKTFPFHSSRKRAGVVVQASDAPEGDLRVYMKGASEMVLSLCTKSRVGDEERVMTEVDRQAIQNVIASFASQAMRTICLAYRTVNTSDWLDAVLSVEERSKLSPAYADMEVFRVETELTLLCLVGIEDPLRDEVPAAIARCRKAGVDVRMVTGDNLDTAVAIAKGCNVLRAGEDLDDQGRPLPMRAMTGPDFRKKVLIAETGKIDQVAFDEVWPYLRVLARSSPTDKYILVSGMMDSDLYLTERGQKLGIYPDRQVVALTGDGTNDAPALKKADIGFAMGITGTQVAKDAADIILMDDNFSSIVKACMWGRNVYESISKFLQFQLTINIVAISLAITGALASSQSPIKPVQMLWINLIMDSLASLALATEPPSDSLLDRAPYGRNSSLVKTEMWWNMIGHALYQYIFLVVFMFKGAEWMNIPSGLDTGSSGGHHGGASDATQHLTIVFNAFVLMQLVNQINMRKLHHELNPFNGFTSNTVFLIIVLIELAGQILIVFFGGQWFKVKSLDWDHWLVCIIAALLEFPVQTLIVLAKKFYDKSGYARRRKNKKHPILSPGAPPAGPGPAAAPALAPPAASAAAAASAGPVRSVSIQLDPAAGGLLYNASKTMISLRGASRSSSNAGITKSVTRIGSHQQQAELVNAAKSYRASLANSLI